MPAEDPGPGEVQVRVAAVGICGSDVHYYSEGSVGDTPCVFPMVIGHEPSGTVVKCGAGVTGWRTALTTPTAGGRAGGGCWASAAIGTASAASATRQEDGRTIDTPGDEASGNRPRPGRRRNA